MINDRLSSAYLAALDAHRASSDPARHVAGLLTARTETGQDSTPQPEDRTKTVQPADSNAGGDMDHSDSQNGNGAGTYRPKRGQPGIEKTPVKAPTIDYTG